MALLNVRGDLKILVICQQVFVLQLISRSTLCNSAEGEQVAGDKVTCVAEQLFDVIDRASAEVTMSLFRGMIHSPIATS